MCSIVVFSMNEVDSESMLSVLTNTLSCEVGIITQRKMPRVVPDQRSTFDNDELFRRLSRECEVKFKKFYCRVTFFHGSFGSFLKFEMAEWFITYRWTRISLPTNSRKKGFVDGFVLWFQVKYTGFRDRPLEERQLRFQTECREGHADIVSYYFNLSV